MNSTCARRFLMAIAAAPCVAIGSAHATDAVTAASSGGASAALHRASDQVKKADAKTAPTMVAGKARPGSKNMINPQPLPPKVLKSTAPDASRTAR